MSLQTTFPDPDAATCQALARALAPTPSHDLAAPIRAGMRARAVADACERLALPAVLIDRTGRVLHAGHLAHAQLAGSVTIVERHLVGRTASARRSVSAAVSEALGNSPVRRHDRVLTGLAYKEATAAQLLRGVIILGRQGRDGRRRMAALRQRLAEASRTSNALDVPGPQQ